MTAPNLANYANLNIGDYFNTDYCDYPNKDSNASLYCGTNGEFIYGGNQGVTCNVAGYTLGQKKRCQRSAFRGDQTQCCTLGGPDYYYDTDGTLRTCAFDYRRNNFSKGGCNIPFQTYCKQGTNLFGGLCRDWITSVTQGQTVGNGTVDDVVITVCNRPENAERPECGCVISANNLARDFPTAQNIPVQCMYNACANNVLAYRTTNQMGDCNIVYCEMNINDLEIIANNPETFDVDFTQDCSNNQTNPPAPGQPSNPNQPVEQPITSSVWFWVVIIIVILIIGFLIYYFGFKKKKTTVTTTTMNQTYLPPVYSEPVIPTTLGGGRNYFFQNIRYK